MTAPAPVPEVGGGDELRKLCAEAAETLSKYSGLLREIEKFYHGTSKAAPVFEDLARRLHAAAVAR